LLFVCLTLLLLLFLLIIVVAVEEVVHLPESNRLPGFLNDVLEHQRRLFVTSIEEQGTLNVLDGLQVELFHATDKHQNQKVDE